MKGPICTAPHLPEILFARTVFGGCKLRLLKHFLLCVAMRIHAWDAMLIERRNEPALHGAQGPGNRASPGRTLLQHRPWQFAGQQDLAFRQMSSWLALPPAVLHPADHSPSVIHGPWPSSASQMAIHRNASGSSLRNDPCSGNRTREQLPLRSCPPPGRTASGVRDVTASFSQKP
jgi:hypothetical protein